MPPDLYADDFGKKSLPNGQRPNAFNLSYGFAKAAASADKIYFGIVPAGHEINALALVHDADADGTLSIGYEPYDALAVGAPAANPTYFFNAQALSAAGRKESVAQPISFKFPVKLVGTLGGGGIVAGTKLTVVLDGNSTGVA